jgi:transposase
LRNGKTSLSFLKKLRRARCHTGRHAILILDNVTYHYARLHLYWCQKSREYLILEFMPPYSPELNSIEHSKRHIPPRKRQRDASVTRSEAIGCIDLVRFIGKYLCDITLLLPKL